MERDWPSVQCVETVQDSGCQVFHHNLSRVLQEVHARLEEVLRRTSQIMERPPLRQVISERRRAQVMRRHIGFLLLL